MIANFPRSAAAIAALLAACTLHAQTPAAPGKAPRALDIGNSTEEKFTGDFDRMVERRRIRVLVPYSRTLYFNDKGTQRGLTADLMREFEQFLNRKYGKQLGKRPITLILVPTTRDVMFDDVAGGLADIAAGNLSITESRLNKVDFAHLPDLAGNSEVIATGPKSPQLASLDDLAGKTIHMRKIESYRETVNQLNERFAREGKPKIRIVDLPDALEDEDKLEMLGVGLVELVVVDDWKGKIWAQVLKDVKIREDLALKKDVKVGWAIRKGSPKLKAEIEEFMRQARKASSVGARQKVAMSHAKKFRNNTADAEIKRFNEVIALFRKYGDKYGFDPLMLAAQGYQESQLNQNAKSHVGAIGVMQVMPATGKELKVGDVAILENNIHAGTKYMDQLMTRYFQDARFSDADRPLFAFASYNAGPGRIARMRTEASKRGLDPDKWFNNVEIVTAEKVGIETSTYVRNIYKYYVAYTLSVATLDERQKARESITAPKK
ncbi:MAG: transglycosylase SLT domain-containing protein [Burkholderiaceae bacterium]|jgi:membrane-bound lytic murein transglycosylase MltF|nr:transglycosylase SLT domain-containing protein [Burkholderiaceae bacterium]